jgi:hypothetical protein
MELQYDELKQIIIDSVEEALNDKGTPPNCPINCGNGLTPSKHRYHHEFIDKMEKDISKIRTSFIAGILVMVSSGIGTLIWTIFCGGI